MNYDPKKITFTRRTATGRVLLVPCLLFSVVIVSDAVGVADGLLYNGASTGGDLITDLACLNGGMEQLKFNPPLYFDKGIYLVVGTNVESVLFQFMEFME